MSDTCRRCDRPRARGYADCDEHRAPELRQEDSVPTRFEVDDEPDWEAILEARAEARMEADLERAEAAYERWIYGD